MNFYSIGYSSYEECPDITLCHEKEFNRDELEDMIIKALRIVIPQRKYEYNFQSNYGELLMGYDKEMPNVIDVLCKEFGFLNIKYTASHSAFGWASIFDDKDWESDSKGLDKIRAGIMDLKPKDTTNA